MTLRRAFLPIALLLVLQQVACVAPETTSEDSGADEVAVYTIPYFAWMDPYRSDPGEKRFFDIDRLMGDYNLSRMQAVEIQNRYRDRVWNLLLESECRQETERDFTEYLYESPCLDSDARVSAFREGLQSAQASALESGWTRDEFENADFIVVFDIDETLVHADYSTGSFQTAPGWDTALRLVKESGGHIVLFTANQDVRAARLLEDWTIQIDGLPVPVREYVDGVFTNHYLVMQGVPGSDPRGTVTTPSKDLRIVDETLDRVVIIDDNPSRIWQHRNLRYVSKWTGGVAGDAAEGNFQNARLLRAVNDILDSKRWADEHGVSLADAFVPYSFVGRQTTEELSEVMFDGDFRAAVEFVRLSPDAVDEAF